MIKKQFTLYLENKPGVLASVTKKLASKKINIEGISISEGTDVGLVQIVPDNAALAKKVLSNAGIPYTVQNVCLVTLQNRVGALYNVVAKLAATHVNVNYVYATTCAGNKDCRCYVVISAPDLKAVEKAYKAVMKQ